MMTDILSSYNSYMNNTFGGNEMLIGMVTTMFLSIIVYSIREYPLRLYRFILKHSTRTLEVSSDSYVYTDIMKTLEDEGIFLKARNFRLKNGIWGWSKEHEKTLGVSTTWYLLKGSIVRVHIYQEEMTSDRVIHSMRLMVVNNSRRVIDELINDSNNKKNDPNKTNVYRVTDGRIELFSKQIKYTLKDVILTDAAAKAVENALEFSKSEESYRENGFAWKYGMLLHGVPGTGKTKLSKCIAGELGWDILEIKSISDMAFLSKLDGDKNTVVIIEELDKLLASTKDLDDNDKPVDDGSNGSTNQSNDTTTMGVVSDMMKGDFLTAVDGVCELNGVLLIATTNHINRLDKALYRDGRMDEVVEFKYMTMDDFKKFFYRYYPNGTIPDGYTIKECTGSNMEKTKKNELTETEFLEKFKKEIK